MQTGILSWGSFVPRLRLDRKTVVEANRWANGALVGRAAGSRAFCNWDEDTLTMGVEAARASVSRREVLLERLIFASTTAPFQDRPSSVMAAAALQLPTSVKGTDQCGSQRAGSSALVDALERHAASLVIASETRHASPGTVQELAYGDAAAALTVGSGDVVAHYLGGVCQSADFADHFRTTGQDRELHWEERWVRDEGIGKLVPQTINALLTRTGVDPVTIDHFIFPTVFPKLGEQLALRVGIPKSAVCDDLSATVGEAGSAHALLMLAATLDVAQPGQKILLASFGYGCDALLFETTEAIKTFQGAGGVSKQINRASVEKSYQKFLSFKGEVKIDFGLRFEAEVKTALTAQYRRGQEMAGFIAGRCPNCGAVQFPRAGVCVNPECDQIGEQSPVSLLDQPGTIVSFTVDWLSFKGAPPFCFGLVQFDCGARVLMEFVDFAEGELEIGIAVRSVYRKKEIDSLRRYHSYFWKAAPAAA